MAMTPSSLTTTTTKPSAFSNIRALFRPGALSTRKAIDLVNPWKYNSADYPSSNFRNYVDEAYKKNELIYACIRELATSVSEASFCVVSREQGEYAEKVYDHPAYMLLENPNDEMDQYEFWETNITLEHIAGTAYVWKERDDYGFPIALWPIRPDWIKPRYTRAHTVAFYEYFAGGVATGVKIPRADILAFRHGVDPTNMYGEGLSPLKVCFRNTSLDNNITDYMKVFFENAAVPFGMIKVKRRLENPRIANRIRMRWQQQYSGNKGWHAPAVLDEDAEYVPLGLDLQQLKIEALRNVPETRICMSFGVPPTLVGAEAGLQRSTYSNYREARGSFWDETLAPLFKKYAARMTKELLPEFLAPEMFMIKADLSEVRALQEDQTQKWLRATNAAKAGVITVNMFLEEIGKTPVDGGDVFLRGGGVNPVELGEILPTMPEPEEDPDIIDVTPGADGEVKPPKEPKKLPAKTEKSRGRTYKQIAAAKVVSKVPLLK
jgi:HK97 family phage portal protein